MQKEIQEVPGSNPGGNPPFWPPFWGDSLETKRGARRLGLTVQKEIQISCLWIISWIISISTWQLCFFTFYCLFWLVIITNVDSTQEIIQTAYWKLCTLTAHNWQKWKRVFLTCPCHEIYRDEAVGLKSCKNTWKITIFVKMWNLGQYRENLIFCQYNNFLIKAWILKILLHTCDTYNYDYLKHSTLRFNLSIFSYIQISLSNFAFFTVKSPSVTQRSVSQENA